ncbi:5' exonuclease Apollo-like [Styela clava]
MFRISYRISTNMNGHILHELPVAVDYFTKTPDVQLYFLTHVHSDHTVGLTKYWKKKVYCSYVTGKLLHFKLKIEKHLIIPLKELQSHVFRIQSKKGWHGLSVTLIPVQHCPGSSMFLFETNDVKILYTGDFRPDNTEYEIGKTLWGPRHRPIDVLYLDNTYCEPSCAFPSRDEAIEEIAKICKSHLDCNIFIGVNWTGHEDLLVKLALKMEQQIAVTNWHLQLFKLLEVKNVFTCDEYSSNIQVLRSNQVNLRRLKEINENEEDCIGIVPTAKKCHVSSGVLRNDLIYTVPYSNHSSFTELWEFVECVRPRKIKPIVSGKKPSGMESYFRADMTQFDCLLNCEKVSPIESQLHYSIHPIPEMDNFTDDDDNINACPKRKHKPIAHDISKIKQRRKKPCGVVFDEND